LINIVDKFGPELLVIQFGVLVILSTLLMWLWFANRRKYHNLQHAIPANIIKSYLDSIIQNSTALKSNLFRGGGLDVGQVPSVMSLGNLGTGGDGLTVSGSGNAALLEELNQKKAYIAQLESQLNAAKNGQKDIEAKLATTQSQLSTAEARIRELEALLAKTKSSGGTSAVDVALQAEIQSVTRERDEIRDRLKEYEIIADDLANLKRLQQENEQLKRSLAQAGGAAPVSAPEPEKTEAKIAEVSDLFEDMAGETTGGNTEDLAAELDNLLSGGDAPADAPVEDISLADAPSESKEEKNKNEKTPDDLLSEFEKMLS
jgi:predicted nuclease with TOPRIM domain